jgi:hypothetical protein
MPSLLIFALCFSLQAGAKVLDFKPMSVDVGAQDHYLIKGFKGKVNLVGQSRGNRLAVTLRQLQPDNLSSEMKDIMEEWIFSVQRRDNVIEIMVRPPHSKTSLAKTLQSQQMPTFEVSIQGPARETELALREGSLKIENWSAPLKIYAQKSDVSIRNCEGELHLGVQEGQVHLLSHKGAASIESYSAKVNVKEGSGALSVVNFSGTTDIQSQQGPIELNGYQGGFQVSKGQGRLEFDVDRSTVKVGERAGDLRGKSKQGAVIASLQGESDVRLSTVEGNVSLSLANSGAYLNVGSEEGQVYAPNYLQVSRLPNIRLVQGRLHGKLPGQVYVRSQSGTIRIR